MKKLLFLLCVVVAGSMFYSCEKDNLEGPDAIFAGELRDRKTGELIQQEISDGSRVYFIEQGWGDNCDRKKGSGEIQTGAGDQ